MILVEVLKVSFHISPEVIFGRIPIEKNILCSHLGQNHSESRTVATWRAPPIIDSHDFWWFSDSLGTSPKQKLLGNSTWIAKPAIFKKPLGAPSRVWLHHSNLELQLGMVASISFYLEKRVHENLDLHGKKQWPKILNTRTTGYNR